MLPRLGDHTPIAYLPLQDEEGKTDLDFLLVVVDLPGNVNVHCAPLPWFLERKRATWSEGRLSGGKKKKQPFPQSCQQILAAEAFFSMKYAGRGEELFGDLEVWKDQEMRKEQGRITFLASENLSTLISTCLPLFLVVCLFSVVLILILLRLC